MSTETVLQSDKQFVSDLVERMPDSATLDHIREELSIVQAIRDGVADAEAGRIMTHAELVRRSETWISQ